jgi:D-alanyl-D-alanine carboxypeptidase/Putative peptidoglycan binding domain
MLVLRRGSDGDEVRQWQRFLIGQKLLKSAADGMFGPITEKATKAFQRKCGLVADGVVGPMTYAAALKKGFNPGFTDPFAGTEGLDWPPRPTFPSLVGNQARAAIFGEFAYEPVGPNTDQVRVLDDWADRNLTRITVPQLIGVEGAPSSGRIWVHRLVADRVRTIFQEWEDAGLGRLVLSWAGSYVARFVRGSRSNLSNHAWGTAFDINAEWNALAAVPPLVGERGSVRPLVPIANQHGFYWGGHFSRSDGMHFEAAR